jgi:hypothetical protein|tara:strand:+ start:12439 stop:12735 length:297 start_codon:yes stop_codon:yes gene_type:complete
MIMTFDFNSLPAENPASQKTVRAVANKFTKMAMEQAGFEDSAKNFVILRGRLFAVLCSKGDSKEGGRVTYGQTRKWFKVKSVPAPILKSIKLDGLVKI